MRHLAVPMALMLSAFVLGAAAQPVDPALPPGYYWASCSDPAYSNRVDCDKRKPPGLPAMSQEAWLKLQDQRRCARIKKQCLRMPQAKRQACLQKLEDVC